MSNITTAQSCTSAPANISSNAGISGTGILLAFMVTAALALLLSSYIVFSELRTSNKANTSTGLPKQIARKLLDGLSDQQLISGISIQSLALATRNTLVPYHFFIIWMLSLCSTATNFAALLALVQDFKRDWVLRWIRQIAMAVNTALTIVLGVLVLEVQLKKLPQTLPVGCVWDKDFLALPDVEKASSNTGSNALSTIGTIAVIVASGIIFVLGTWYLHLRVQIWGRTVRVVSLLVLWAMAIGAIVRVIMVSQAFGTPSVEIRDEGEKTWTFGQLLAIVLLVGPFINALEIFRGQLQVPPCQQSTSQIVESDQIPLTESESGKHRYTYQPAPWFQK